MGELTILVLLLIMVSSALLYKKFAADKKLKRPAWNFGDYNVVVAAAVSLVAFVISLNILQPGPSLSDPDTIIDYGINRHKPRYTQWGYEKKILKDSAELSNHFHALEARAVSEKAGLKKESFNYFDNNINVFDFYSGLRDNPDTALKDAGYFGLACYDLFRNKSAYSTRKNLSMIYDQQKPYVQYVYGLADENSSAAADYFKNEIRNKGFARGAVAKLAAHYYLKGDQIGLLQLYQDPRSALYLDNYYKKFISYRNLHIADYLSYEFQMNFKLANLPGIFGALLIFLLWFYYFDRVDIYQRKKKRDWIFVAACFFIFPVFTAYGYSFLHVNLKLVLNGEWMNDLAYFTGGVGLLEELIKIIPFLLVLRFTRLVNEPIDYIIFGSLSALTFSFIENILYFDEAGLQSIHGRALWSSLMHMFYTCIITYMLMLARFRWIKSAYVWFWPAVCIAALVHGLYDYVLLSPQLKDLWFCSFAILLSSILVFTSMINNCLNNSPFYDYYISVNLKKLGAIVCAGLLGIIIYEYTTVTFIHGTAIGNYQLIDSLLSSWYPLIFLGLRLTGLDLITGRWEPLRFFASLNPFIFIMRRKINFVQYIGKEIIFNGAKKNALILEYMPLSGTIRSRKVISGYTGWFVVELKKPLTTKKQSHSFILIRSREKNIPLDEGNVPVGIFLIPDIKLLEEENNVQEDFIFLEWVLMN
jgi:protease PrsW